MLQDLNGQQHCSEDILHFGSHDIGKCYRIHRADHLYFGITYEETVTDMFICQVSHGILNFWYGLRAVWS